MRISLQELFEAGVHVSHQKKRWNPKIRPYIFDYRNGMTIINLVKTNSCMAAMEGVRPLEYLTLKELGQPLPSLLLRKLENA